MLKVIKKLRHYTEIEFSNKKYNIENEVFYKHNLHKDTNINELKFQEIVKDNELFYYDRLAKGKLKKQHTEKELSEFLRSKGASKTIIDSLIKDYNKLNYVDDLDYIKSYISYTGNRQGPKLIIEKLKSKGLNLDLIISEVSEIDEVSNIKDIVNKTIKNKIMKNKFQITNETKNYLINKGYDESLVISIVDELFENIEINENIFIEKDFSIMKSKYENKFNNEKLKEIISSKLYENGYSEELIAYIVNKEL